MSTPEPAQRGGPAEPDAAEATEASEASATGSGGAAEPAASGTPAPADGRAASWLDFLPSPMFLLLLGLTGVAGWFSWTRAEQGWTEAGDTAYMPFVLLVGAWIGCLTLQEYGRSVLAYRFGDRALRGTAYLRLNPFGYSELFAGVLMPVAFLLIGGFGMTGPALQLDRSSVPSRAARSLAAVGGVVVNLVIAAALLLTVQALIPEGAVTDNWTISALVFLCYLNVTAALINLLPVPGLAGFDVIAPYLPERPAAQARSAGLFGTIAVFAVLAFPQVNMAFLNVTMGLVETIGLNQNYVGYGQTLLWPWSG